MSGAGGERPSPHDEWRRACWEDLRPRLEWLKAGQRREPVTPERLSEIGARLRARPTPPLQASAAPTAETWLAFVEMLEALPPLGSDPVGEALAALERLPAHTRAWLVISLASGEAPAKRLARAWKDADPDIRRLFLARVTGRTT